MHFAYRYVKYGPAFTSASIGLMFAFLQIFPQLQADAGFNDNRPLATVVLGAGLLLSWIPFLFVLGNRRRR